MQSDDDTPAGRPEPAPRGPHVRTAVEAAAEEAAREAAALEGIAAEEAARTTGEPPARRRAQGPIRPRPQERPPFAESRKLEKEWWLRVPLVLASPRAVFTALRDDRDVAAEARQEPMIALLFLAGLSIFFMSRTASTLYDSSDYDPVAIALEAIVTAPLTAFLTAWVGGLAVRIGLSAAGAQTRWRQARHLVGLAQVPLILPLVTVFPARLAVYGSDMFRSGGADSGAGVHVFDALNLAFVAWAVALLVLGTRAVWGWSWQRTLLALVPGLAVLAGVAALLIVA